MKRINWPLAVLALLLLSAALLMFWLAIKPEPPEPLPPTATVTATATPVDPTDVPPTLPPTATATTQPTATATAVPPTVAPTATATAVPATTTPQIALLGWHRVERGHTLWDTACDWYDFIPLLPGANPLTPCTCWPGIAKANPIIKVPQYILPGWHLAIPEQCQQ